VGIWKREAEGMAAARVPAPRAEVAQPEFLNAGTQLRTSLGADSEVTGRLSFSAPTRIDGKLRRRHRDPLVPEFVINAIRMWRGCRLDSAVGYFGTEITLQFEGDLGNEQREAGSIRV